ncbi:MAG: tetratricopeptide repeat protein [Candidatus Melainabacteria bacterium]|nr:tetratricopeptide repeat protein [Candidatus Melainabacteria bacterium]
MRRVPLSIYALIICLLAGIGCKASADNRMMMTGDDPYNLRVLAFQCYIEGQTESALETYQRAVKRAIEEYGDDSTIVADIYYEMGSLAFDAGKENTAESWLNESLKRNPNSEMARIKLAEIYRVRSKHDQALAQIQTCLKRNRNSITARRALVVWLQEKGFVALATQESFVLNQISRGNKDHRIAPSASMQVATATKHPSEASARKEEAAPTKAAEPKPEANQQESKGAEKVKAPTSIVAALMKQALTAAKKKEQPAAKPVVKQPVVKKPVVVQQPKKVVKPEPKKEEKKKEDPKQEVAKAPPAKKIEKPPAPRIEPPVVATTQPKRSKNGLVPPPPPMMPPFGMFPPPPPMGFNNGPLLQTHAALKKEKPKAEPKESPKETKEAAKDTKDTASVDEEGEGDFLIDWAATKKKKKTP